MENKTKEKVIENLAIFSLFLFFIIGFLTIKTNPLISYFGLLIGLIIYLLLLIISCTFK